MISSTPPPADTIVSARAANRRIAEPFREVLSSSPRALVEAYVSAHPRASSAALDAIVRRGADTFLLSGVDLMPMREIDGRLTFRVLEVNSAPGFAYCTPGHDAWLGAYVPCIEALLTHVADEDLRDIALITESKVPVETVGFAACLQYLTGRPA